MIFFSLGKPIMPVARLVLQRTLVRGTQCPNNQHNSHQTHHVHTEQSTDIDLSQLNHRTERLKQKYDHSGKLIYYYGKRTKSII